MGSIDELIYDLHSGDEKARAFAAEDIAFDGVPGGIKILIERLELEESRFVREVIVNCLKGLKGREIVEKIIPLLSSEDAFIRNASIEILSMQGEIATEFMRKILGDADKDIRKFALDILFQLKSLNTAELIAEALNDLDINNIITAVEYLGHMEDTNYTPKVNELLMRSDNILLRCTCLEALAFIGDEESIRCVNKMYPSYENISILEQYSFLKFVARKGADIHLSLIISLIAEKGQVMHKEIINAVEGILKRNPRKVLPHDLLNSLSYYLTTDIPNINKYELLILMGHYQNQEIYSILLQHVDHEKVLIRMGAVEGLGIYGNKEALPILLSMKEKVGDHDLLETLDKSIALLQ
ncbi:MAG: HEAT repeat domain-containing protein [Syntrophomonadaceae bacterium]